MSLISFWSI